ncbi:hypothetical protein NRE35_004255 [Salmonella enterica]|nr:hypothetical protein [Salmonella enterica]
MAKINQLRLHKEMFSYDLEVHEKRGCTPEHLYSINCTLYETGRRDDPIKEPFLSRAKESEMVVIGKLNTYYEVTPEYSYRAIELKRIVHVVVGSSIDDVHLQMEEIIEQGSPTGTTYIAGTVKQRKELEKRNKERGAW